MAKPKTKIFKQSKSNNRDYKKISAIALVGLLIVGGIYAALSLASTGICGKRVLTYTYSVPFGNSIWNQPVCSLPKYSRSADYSERFYKWGNLNDGSPGTELLWGDLAISAAFPKPTATDPNGLSTLFSRNVYNAKDATTKKQIQTSVSPSNLDGIKSESSTAADRLKYRPDTAIPWNPNWLTGEGGDNEIVVLDDSNGRIYEISGYKRDAAAVAQCGLLLGDRLCAYSVKVGRDNIGNYFDYRSYQGPFNTRGAGISMYATLTTPQEIAAGEIRHALGIAIPNTATGPICTSSQLGTSAEGTVCGTAVGPASKFEFGSITPAEKAKRYNYPASVAAIYTQDKLIPEGMRFALDIDDTYIENWIKTRPDLLANSRKAETARIFAKALRDYGMIVADTSGNKARIQVAGMVNPQTRDAWKSVGIESDTDNNLLEGLIKKEKLYVVELPKLFCADGTISNYYCIWTKAEYTATTSTPTPTPAPTPTSTPSPTPSSTNSDIPTMPSSLTSPSAFTDRITVAWTASKDNIGVAGYNVYLNTRLVAKTPLLNFTLTGLQPNTNYSISVSAYDAVGNESAKQTKSFKTKTGCLLLVCW